MNKIGIHHNRSRLFRYTYVVGLVGLLLVVALSLVGRIASARHLSLATAPTLGTAGSFAVLGASTVTNTGLTVVNGNLGLSPGTSVTGFPPGVVNGTIHVADAIAVQGQNDLNTAYNALTSQACEFNMTGQDLGGKTLAPGVYCFSSTAQLTGTLTLNGSPTDVWVFQIGTSLTTASGSAVIFTNAQSCNVFWQVGTSATIGTATHFVGNILASASITINTSASLSGRALAHTGAVTLDTNAISIPTCVIATATPTNSPVPPTNTPLPATATAIAPTIAPTLTAIAATQTAVAPTVAPTLTAIAATQTAVAPTVAPTLTAIAATQTAIAPTVAPTLTAIAATQTAVAPTVAPTLTAIAATLTAIPATQTAIAPTIAPTLTAIAATQTAVAPTIAPTLTAIAATQTAIATVLAPTIAPTLTAIAATQTAIAPTATPTATASATVRPTATSTPIATATTRPTTTEIPGILPATGFKPGVNTTLSKQPADKAYSSLGDLWLEIPRLGLQASIVGVPQTGGEWDVSWLGQNVGWLNGSAYPTWNGNSVLTGHVWDANNQPGPFYGVNTLWWGDQVIVHSGGGQYVYEVRSVIVVSPGNTAAMMKHQELPWITLVTCHGYDAVSNSYSYRVLVRAVLVEVK